MNCSRLSVRRKSWARLAAILITVFVAWKAYGQQEIAPTWYDPWATPNQVAVRDAKPQAGNHEPKQRTTNVSTHPGSKKGRTHSSPAQRQTVAATRRSHS